MKKILITGASGFIGSFLVEEALKRDYEVYAGIRKTSDLKYLLDPRINFIELDFSELPVLQQQLNQCPYFDFVIHNAGLTNALKKSDNFIANYQYTKNLIDVLMDQKKIPQKFIYMSSLAAQGPGSEHVLEPLKVSDHPRPVTSYGKSKLKAEKYISQLRDFPYIIIRPTAVYGPREKNMFIVYKLINKRLEFIIGFKKQYLTFIYVKDLADAIFKAVESSSINTIYFVSDGKIYNSKILGNKIKAQLGITAYRFKIPVGLIRLIALMVEAKKLLTRKKSVLNYDKVNELECVNWKCDVGPLFEELKFTPKYSLNQGISETISWYKEIELLK